MKKIKVSSVLLTIILVMQMAASTVLSAESAYDFTPEVGSIALVPSVLGSSPPGNLLTFGSFNSPSSMNQITSEGSSVIRVTDKNGGYIRVTNIPQSHIGARYTPENTIGAGKYLFTGYFRTLRTGQLTELRIIFCQANGENKIAYVYPTNDWMKVEYYVEPTDTITYIKICGGAASGMRQDYCFDQFSLTAVDTIPSGSSSIFGTKVTSAEVEASMNKKKLNWAWDPEIEAQYEVEGLIVNQDFSGFLGSAASNGITSEEIIQFAKQFEGTHITDYFISINDVCSMFPNGVTTSYLDKYYWTEENGYEVDYTEQSQAKGSYYLYETLGVDPIGILGESFKEIGINPWLSVRMNDAHDMISGLKTSIIFSEFYHNNPGIRRVRHHNFVTYYDRVMDYTYDSVREYMLSFINEALNRYDTYGIELDFQREMWLWHIGGEYNGLDIFNDFMRQLDDLVAVYEEKYGHKIKIATRVAYDLETNYAFGLDVLTWMAEGIVDMMIPASRWSTVDMDIPTSMWDSITELYGVELAVSMEKTQLSPCPGVTPISMDIETMSALAANAFSQGAEKVYLFNYYRSTNTFFTSGEKFNSKDPNQATMWSVLCTLGSHEKLMLMNRRNIITWKDMKPIWLDTVQYLPKNVTVNEPVTLRIPIGDIADGSKVTLRFSVSESTAFDSLPTVNVNGVTCEYNGAELCAYPFTDDMLMCYDIPESLQDDGYLIAEITAENSEGFTINYAEAYIEAPELILN